MAGIATFSNNPNANTGIQISGTFGGGVAPQGSNVNAQATAPTNNQYLLAPAGNPAAQTSGGQTTIGGGGGGYAGPDLSSYNQSIDATNAQLNNLSPQLGVGLASNQNNYQTSVDNLNQGKYQANQSYTLDKNNSGLGYVNAKNTINDNTGNTISSLSRLLGARGGAGESAGSYAASLAAAHGTQQRQGAATSFGQNNQALDTNYNNYLGVYNQNLQNAALQKTQSDNQINASYDTNRANLLQSLASLINQRTSASGGTGTSASQPYVDEANGLLHTASGLNTPTPVGAQITNHYVAPTLASYSTNPTAIAAGANAGAVSDAALPYLSLLTNRDKQIAGAQA